MAIEVKIPTSGWVQEPIIGACDILRDLTCPRAVVRQEIAPKDGQRRWLSVSLVEVRGEIEISGAAVYTHAPEGGEVEMGDASHWDIRLVR